MTLRAAARRHGLGWHLINGVVKAWADLCGRASPQPPVPRCCLVDETSMRKRHRYVTVIVNGDTGQTLAMVQHRSSAALSTFLMQQGHRWCKGVKVVVSRRLQGLQVRHRRPPRPRPPRAGPLPRHQMVLSGAHPGPPRHPAPP